HRDELPAVAPGAGADEHARPAAAAAVRGAGAGAAQRVGLVALGGTGDAAAGGAARGPEPTAVASDAPVAATGCRNSVRSVAEYIRPRPYQSISYNHQLRIEDPETT